MARIYKGLGTFFVKISGYRAYIERMERENPGCGEPSGGEIRAYLQKQGNPIDNLYQEAEMDSRHVEAHLADRKKRPHNPSEAILRHCASRSKIIPVIPAAKTA